MSEREVKVNSLVCFQAPDQPSYCRWTWIFEHQHRIQPHSCYTRPEKRLEVVVQHALRHVVAAGTPPLNVRCEREVVTNTAHRTQDVEVVAGIVHKAEVVPGIAPLNTRRKQQMEVAHSLIECKTQAKGGGGGNLYTTPSNAKGEEDKPPTPH